MKYHYLSTWKVRFGGITVLYNGWIMQVTLCTVEKNYCLILKTQLTAYDLSFFLTKYLFDSECVLEATKSSFHHENVYCFKPFLNNFRLSN